MMDIRPANNLKTCRFNRQPTCCCQYKLTCIMQNHYSMILHGDSICEPAVRSLPPPHKRAVTPIFLSRGFSGKRRSSASCRSGRHVRHAGFLVTDNAVSSVETPCKSVREASGSQVRLRHSRASKDTHREPAFRSETAPADCQAFHLSHGHYAWAW